MKSVPPLTLVAWTVVASLPVAAQDVRPVSHAESCPPASSFVDLQGRLKADQTVYVQTAEVADAPSRGIKGKVLELSDSTLRLLVDGQRREFSERDVRVVSDRYHNSARKGAGIGALIGLAVGVGLGLRNVAQSCSRPGDSCGTARAVLVLGSGAFTALGAEVGALTAAQSVHERVLFLAP